MQCLTGSMMVDYPLTDEHINKFLKSASGDSGSSEATSLIVIASILMQIRDELIVMNENNRPKRDIDE